MTSHPASRSARATTLMPRSCPSRPGLASRIRRARPMVLLTCSTRQRRPDDPVGRRRGSNDRGLAVLAVNSPQHAADLAERGVRAHALQDVVHGIFRAYGGSAQGVQSALHLYAIALGAHAPRPVDLPPLHRGINLQRGNGGIFGDDEVVDPHDNPLPTLDLLLKAK